jgi:hypothetical protein
MISMPFYDISITDTYQMIYTLNNCHTATAYFGVHICTCLIILVFNNWQLDSDYQDYELRHQDKVLVVQYNCDWRYVV